MRHQDVFYIRLGKEAHGRDSALETLGPKGQRLKDKERRGWVMHIVQQQFAVFVISANGPERVAHIAWTGVGARRKLYSLNANHS